MNFWRKAIAITWKDVLSEIRTKNVIFSVLVFTLLVIVIFNFAFAGSELKTIAPGMLWVTFTFAGVLSLNHSFVQEKEEGCLQGLMVCPVSRETIYIGKMLGVLLFMLIIETIALVIFAVLFNLAVLSVQIIVITVLSTTGFAAVGTLFSALAVNTRARDMILPILFLPVAVPVIIGAVKATELALTGTAWSGLLSWLQIIGAFDVIFITVAYLVFAFVIEE